VRDLDGLRQSTASIPAGPGGSSQKVFVGTI
jgi:hypothetical protein